jgi:hypothetical protein
MRRNTLLSLVLILANQISAPGGAQTIDDSLRVYAVNVVKTSPFEKPFVGYGIYLGRGAVITAAHVVGHWPYFTHPHVRIAGQNLAATVVKEGSFEQTDLALLSVPEDSLPVSLRLRRNPLCKMPPTVGMRVIDVVPEKTTRLQIISPLLIEPTLRIRFNTLINSPQSSGSGIFDAERKCLLGIVSAEVATYRNKIQNGHVIGTIAGSAGYFVAAAKIASFIPPDYHF